MYRSKYALNPDGIADLFEWIRNNRSKSQRSRDLNPRVLIRQLHTKISSYCKANTIKEGAGGLLIFSFFQCQSSNSRGKRED